MTEITTTTSGGERVQAGLARLAPRGADVQRQIIRPLGDRYLHALIDATPRSSYAAPGAQKLADSYDASDQAYGATEAHYRIVNRAPYLRYVLNGRGAVRASRARALRFIVGDQVIFRKSVGPAAANNYPARVRAQMEPQIAAAQAQIAGLVIRIYEGGA